MSSNDAPSERRVTDVNRGLGFPRARRGLSCIGLRTFDAPPEAGLSGCEGTSYQVGSTRSRKESGPAETLVRRMAPVEQHGHEIGLHRLLHCPYAVAEASGVGARRPEEGQDAELPEVAPPTGMADQPGIAFDEQLVAVARVS